MVPDFMKLTPTQRPGPWATHDYNKAGPGSLHLKNPAMAGNCL